MIKPIFLATCNFCNAFCRYHSLLKWFKDVIPRTQSCKHEKFLDKHCAVPSLDQHKIGKSSSKLKVFSFLYYIKFSQLAGSKSFYYIDEAIISDT